MPWREVSAVDQREEFVLLARSSGNVRAACRRTGISPTTGYKWMGRYEEDGRDGLGDRSRRPHASPCRTAAEVEARILALRDEHPAWGARKLRRRLEILGMGDLPSTSTITEILRRNGRLDAERGSRPRDFVRFERAEPNELWQMDFKGHLALPAGRCHPLTVLDDHSRFAIALEACADEQGTTVQQRLVTAFRRYGMPWCILADNGPPWGDDTDSRHTWLTVWLLQLGIAISHGRPYHPQTQGKAERFHRSLLDEVFDGPPPTSLDDCQRRFDHWRHVYNTERPHDAIALEVPVTRYRPSPRDFPETLPGIVYDSGQTLRRVSDDGRICFRNRLFRVGKAFKGKRVALRPASQDACFDICFGNHRIASISVDVPT